MENLPTHTPPPPDPAPEPRARRKWGVTRWLTVAALGVMAYFGWKQYDAKAARKEAKALGWYVFYTDPFDTIREDWHNAFKKETWQDGVREVVIPADERFQEHRKLLLRLNPKRLGVYGAPPLRDWPGRRLAARAFSR